MDLIIDPDFASKIPPLTQEVYEQLEANILSEGKIYSPLITWHHVIVDGHNRYRILQNHPEIQFSTYEKEFENRYEAIAWICKNQLGRRNLSPEQKKYLIGKQYEAEKASHGKAPGTTASRNEKGRFTVSPQNEDSRSNRKTSQRIAEETKTSKSYVERAEKYAKGIEAADKALPGIKEEILSGTIHPTVKAVVAVAAAPPEDRMAFAEKLRMPSVRTSLRTSKKKVQNANDYAEEISTGDDEHELPGFSPTLESVLVISDGMASSPDRIYRNTPVESIIAELEAALEDMITRWNFSLSVNQPNSSCDECIKQIRLLARKGIEYLNSYLGGRKNDGE